MPTTVELQRQLTVLFLSTRRLNAPAVFFRPRTGDPAAQDALADVLDIDFETWDGANEHNLGVRLDGGYLELDIKSNDDAFAHAFFLAAGHLGVDARAAYGVKRISSIILKVEDQASIPAQLWPRGYKDKRGHWTETRVRASQPPTKSAKYLAAFSRPLPGSITSEGVVVWRPSGKAAALDADLGVEDLEPRAIADTAMPQIARAIAYATLAYWIRAYLDGLLEWDAILTRRLGGWIARLPREGSSINAADKSLASVCWCPIDTPELALDLVAFLAKLGANVDLKVAYLHGEAALARGQNDRVPGWESIGETFGVDAKQGIRRAMRAGLDIGVIEAMSERYIFDRGGKRYIDREEITKGLSFSFSFDELVHEYQNQPVILGTKAHNPFRLYASSELRNDVSRSDMYPGAEPGAILRYSPLHGLLKDDDSKPDEYRVMNTYRGFIIKPTGAVDPAIMKRAISNLDTMLGLLTRDNDAQMLWLKQFIAWTIQHPEIKQQVCPVIIGGQGIGKSRFGSTLMKALFGELAGTADPRILSDDKFLITPFLGRLLTFIDEVRLDSPSSINAIKTLVREDRISGQLKFQDQRDHDVPSRLILAANNPDIGLSPEDAADRALFFIIAWTAANKGMTDPEFQEWARSLKPFYNEFTEMLTEVPIKQHLMRYFVDLPCTREGLEDLTLSSRNDESVVRSTMSKAREVARSIAASACLVAGSDITAWFNLAALRAAIIRDDGQRSRVEASSVLMEYLRAGVIEPAREEGGSYFRFKWGYGKILEKLSEAHNLKLEKLWDTGPGDFDDNPVLSIHGAPPWRGHKNHKNGDDRYRPFDPGNDDRDGEAF